MSDDGWQERQRKRELRFALESITLLATERIATMRTTCKARPAALQALKVVNEWVETEPWPD